MNMTEDIKKHLESKRFKVKGTPNEENYKRIGKFRSWKYQNYVSVQNACYLLRQEFPTLEYRYSEFGKYGIKMKNKEGVFERVKVEPVYSGLEKKGL